MRKVFKLSKILIIGILIIITAFSLFQFFQMSELITNTEFMAIVAPKYDGVIASTTKEGTRGFTLPPDELPRIYKNKSLFKKELFLMPLDYRDERREITILNATEGSLYFSELTVKSSDINVLNYNEIATRKDETEQSDQAIDLNGVYFVTCKPVILDDNGKQAVFLKVPNQSRFETDIINYYIYTVENHRAHWLWGHEISDSFGLAHWVWVRDSKSPGTTASVLAFIPPFNLISYQYNPDIKSFNGYLPNISDYISAFPRIIHSYFWWFFWGAIPLSIFIGWLFVKIFHFLYKNKYKNN